MLKNLPLLLVIELALLLSACDESSANLSSQQPESPTAFLAETITDTTIEVSWKPSPNTQVYLLEHVPATSLVLGDDYEEVARVTETNYVDENLKSRTRYSYRLSALNNKGQSKPAYLLVDTKPAKPGVFRLEMTNVTSSSLHIVWSWPADSEGQASTVSAFIIESKLSGDDYTKIAEIAGGEPEAGYQGQYVLSNLKPKTIYTYRITAVNETGFSSREVNVQTLP